MKKIMATRLILDVVNSQEVVVCRAFFRFPISDFRLLSSVRMRPKIIVVALLLSTSCLMAQQPQISFRLGSAVSTFENNVLYHQLESISDSKVTSILTPTFAAGVHVPLTRQLGVFVEANYMEKGGQIQETFLLPNTGSIPVFEYFETTYKARFIEFPLLVRYKILQT